MRVFIILSLIGFACASQMGYNYQPVSYSNSGSNYDPAAGAGEPYEVPSTAYIPAANSAPSNSAPSYSTASFSTPSYIAPSYTTPSHSTTSYSTQSQSATSYTDQSYNAPAELHKEFYTFSAPENEFEDPEAIQRIIGSVKQGLRVIFIKAPENRGYEDAALALAKHVAHQQTSIYVLNKQADITNLADKFNDISKEANRRPDVHFVKYRTPEDATNAQRSIQSHYDNLGGISQNINGGIAPVINFASQVPFRTAAAQQPQNSYLPSSVLRYRY